jgi:putative thiazole-containing bacteriocin maturation protein
LLVAGSGSLLHSLAAALQEAGLAPFRVLDISVATNWREEVAAFGLVMYVSNDEGLEHLRELDRVCREDDKALLPLLVFPAVAMVGPYVHREAEVGWEDAWRTIRRAALGLDRPITTLFSPFVEALLAHMMVANVKRIREGEREPPLLGHVYLLDLEKLVGSLTQINPHPLLAGRFAANTVRDVREELLLHREREIGGAQPAELLDCFERWTSGAAGIFHTWEEGDLTQLPLALCRVRTVDPRSEGPADVLPAMIRSGRTHKEARRDAGLAGIEAYAERIWNHQEAPHVPSEEQLLFAVGAGQTFAEALHRGLRTCLTRRLKEQITCEPTPRVHQLQLCVVEDEICLYELRLLEILCGEPVVGIGEEIAGCPVVWVNAGGVWFGAVDIQLTLALRRALRQGLERAQCKDEAPATDWLIAASVALQQSPSLESAIPSMPEAVMPEAVRSCISNWEKRGIGLEVMDMQIEPFSQERTVRITGTIWREERSG